jgi:hypothetical protein
MSFAPLPSIDVPELDLRGQFYTSESPVQAWGTVKGRDFYFRARGEYWTFAVSESPDIDPINMQNANHGFFREERYGTQRSDASYIPLDVAAKIVEDCAREYVQSRAA